MHIIFGQTDLLSLQTRNFFISDERKLFSQKDLLPRFVLSYTKSLVQSEAIREKNIYRYHDSE